MWDFDCSDAGAALEEQGVWLCDGAVSERVAQDLRKEILGAHAAGLLRQSGNVLAVRAPDGARRGISQEKPHVHEADVIVAGETERHDVVQACPTLRRLLESEGQLREQLTDARPSLRLDRLEQAKIQVNDGEGGAFPFHFDVAASKGSRRLLTALLYLNPEWVDGDGGEVECLPFPFADHVVPPLDRRLVVFSSNTTMHRVRPFNGRAPRVCVNLWFEGDVSAPFPGPLPAEDYDATVAKIVRVLRKQPMELRAFCKVWYRQTIAQSFRDAFRPSAELDAAVQLHFEEAQEIEGRISPATLGAIRGAFPLEPRVEKVELGGLFDGM